MQPYGQGQLIGSSIDPRLFQQDFSGFTRAAETQAQGMSNLGNQIGQTIGQLAVDFDKRKKEQTEQLKSIKEAEKIGQLIGKMMPEFSDMIAPSLQVLGDQTVPFDQRLAEAESISSTFKARLDLEGLKRQRQMDDLRMQQMRTSMQTPPAGAATQPVSPNRINPLE